MIDRRAFLKAVMGSVLAPIMPPQQYRVATRFEANRVLKYALGGNMTLLPFLDSTEESIIRLN